MRLKIKSIKNIFFLIIILIDVNKIYPISDNINPEMEMVIQKGHSGHLSSIAYSFDGKYIASASWDNTIKLWGINGKLIRTIVAEEPIFSVSFSPDGRYIVSSGNFAVQIWEINGKLIKTIHARLTNMKTLFSPDGKYVAYGSENIVGLRDLKGTIIGSFEGHSDLVTSVSFSPDGKQIATGSRDNTIKLWSIDGKLIRTFEKDPYDGYMGSIIVQFTPNGKYICSLNSAATEIGSSVKLWDLNGKVIRIFGNKRPESFSLSPNGKYIAMGFSRQIEIYGLDGSHIKTINGMGGTIIFSPDSKHILAGLTLLSVEGNLIRTYGGNFPQCNDVAFSSDGKYVASGLGAVIKLWNIDGRLIRTFKGHSGLVNCIEFSHDNKYIVSGSDDDTIKLWDINGDIIKSFSVGTMVNSVAISSDDKYIITGAGAAAGGTVDSNTVKVWNIEGELVKRLEGHSQSVRSVAFSPNGKYIATGSWDNTVILWHFGGRRIETLTAGGGVDSVSFSPDGKYIIVAAMQGRLAYSSALELWSLEGKLIKRFKYVGRIIKAQFNPDGKYIASVSSDKNVKLWNREGALINEFIGHNYAIYGLSFSPDGKHIVTGSSDGTIKIFNIETENHVTLVSAGNGNEWIMYTGDGYFDSSRNGGELVAMVKGLDAFGVDQFAIRNNRPDIILKRVGLVNKELISHYYYQYLKRLRRFGLTEEQLSDEYHVPEAKILDTKENGKFANVSFSLSDSKYNLKKYNIYVNDVPIFGAYGKEITGNNLDKTETIELTSGRNKIEVTCINEKGAESFRALTYADYKGEVRGDLYYIGFGISKYKNNNLNLNYAHKDAQDLGILFSQMKEKFNNIYVKAYLNEEVTVENIKKAKELLKNAKVDDTFVLFIAGHGVHDKDKEATYYYMTYNSDLNNLSQTAADFDLIEDIMQGISPRNKLFLMDTCESGEIEEKTQEQYLATAKSRGLEARTIRNIKIVGRVALPPRTYLYEQDRYIYNDLIRRSGAIVFSSSKGGEYSYEKDDLKNGLFTAEVIKSLKNRNADKNNDGIISTDELRDYVVEVVPKISNDLQHPTVDRDNIYQKFGFPLVSEK